MHGTLKLRTIALLAGMALLVSGAALGATGRKVKTQVQPYLPEMARRMNLRGTVRLEIEVAADGKVTSTKALGGHPLLIQSAEDAIRKWRYEPGPPAKLVIQFDFHPEH